ncbi:hypothetical protein C5167_011240 [Papaver somniferum]|uniref:TF-B3 domain-containing protein n=1 Tax=Papaver somniferum TaxID=3469 RepID=A0A4Y7K2I2_PAPSO|nr:B3 domain-containing transcription factor VRN1-like [Papaver somniferum]RZC67554.1 hypothetical protein C5167_011240 [Papaver somniferum]
MAITRSRRASRAPRPNVFISGGNIVASTDDDGTNEIGCRRPRFFKIIHNAIIQDGNLKIPPEFFMNYGADSHHATLEVPDGLTWDVQLKRNSNGGNAAVSFQIGQLAQFFEYYSIRPGHVLLFKYHGNSHFHVVIFDTSAGEINYPADSSNDEVHFHGYHEGGPSDIKSSEEEEDYCAHASTDEDETSASSEEEEVRVFGKNKRKHVYLRTKEEEDRARRRAKQRATLIGDEFQSENPFFTIALQPSYMNHKYLHIPVSFNEKHMFSHGKKIKAQVEDGRFWLLAFPKDERGRLTIGVASLLKDNDLVVGDIILVELMKEMKSKYLDAKVHIFRA